MVMELVTLQAEIMKLAWIRPLRSISPDQKWKKVCGHPRPATDSWSAIVYSITDSRNGVNK